ncbi:hypothetical protein MYK68_05610 [Gordonia sp. PP30]|uniref:hypothetical protein n=1 Tax=Gordonia sp. PP30 TaxID=2935861 RepID=UPI001FFF00E2|nr:hypothetical protein [Gordonia sp. PP30]UQE76069.1 hypothetical protein MYK68_05610 [Gordonia sp. PP30]
MTTAEVPVPDLLRTLDHAVHRSELKAAGLAMAPIRAAERAGLIAEFRSEFFGPPDIARGDGRRQLLAAIGAYLRLPEVSGLVVGGKTAARLHGVVPLENSHRTYSHYRYDPIEFYNYLDERRTIRRSAATSTHDHRPPSTVVVEGVEVISLARTLVDLWRPRQYAQSDGFVVVGDRILREGIATMAELEAEAALLGPGERQRVTDALALLDGRAQTESQSRSRILLAGLGLPTPELCIDIIDDDGIVVATPPFVWPEQKVIGFCEEVDRFCDFDRRGDEDDRRGWRRERDWRPRHPDGPHRECRERDAIDARLRDLGYQVFRWTGEMIDRDPCNPCGLRRALTVPLPPKFDDPFAW